MTAFCPDGFIAAEFNRKVGSRNAHYLWAGRAQVHFNAARFRIDFGYVIEGSEVEIRIQFAINASQKIEIESCRYTQFVIVGCQQLSSGFLQVGSQQQRISGLQYTPHLIEKLQARHAVKVTDGAAQKQNQQMLSRTAVCSYFMQAVEIFTLEAQNADAIDVAEFALAHGQGSGRNFNRIVPRMLEPAKSFEDTPGLFTAAAAEFGDCNRRGK